MKFPVLMFVAPLLALLPAATGIVRDDARCSIRVSPIQRPAEVTVLLASGHAETVKAGPGAVDLDASREGHYGSGAPGPVYGQIFEVHRFSGSDSARLARAFAEHGDGRAVLVPWDYDASCRPSRWTAAAAWVQPAEAGTFKLRLRPDSLWVDGMPVFDALAARHEPYPLSPVHRNVSRTLPWLRMDRWLTAEQYYELVTALPTNESRWDQPDSAWLTFLRWQADHPELVDHYPANLVEFELGYAVRATKAERVLRAIRPVMAGTYSMAVSIDGGPDRYFHMRTRAVPASEWRSGAVSSSPDPLAEPPTPAGYALAFSGSPSLETLPGGCGAGQPRGGYLHVVDPPTGTGDVRTEWRGWVDELSITRQFPDDTAVAQFSRQAMAERSGSRAADGRWDAPARLWVDSDGALRLEQTTRLEDGRTLQLRGVRVSTDTVACNR